VLTALITGFSERLHLTASSSPILMTIGYPAFAEHLLL